MRRAGRDDELLEAEDRVDSQTEQTYNESWEEAAARK